MQHTLLPTARGAGGRRCEAQGLDAAEFPLSHLINCEYSAHLTDENTLLRQINGPWGLAQPAPPILFPWHKEFHHPNLRPQRSAVFYLRQRAHHLHHLPSPVVFTVKVHLSTPLSLSLLASQAYRPLSPEVPLPLPTAFSASLRAPAWPAVLRYCLFPQAL